MKKLSFLIEFLAKSNNFLYLKVLDFFEKEEIYIPTKYDLKTIKILAKKTGFDIEHEEKLFADLLNEKLPISLIQAKEQLFDTLIKVNFKKEKEQFDKVETSIFKCLSAYISGLTKAFDIFYAYTQNNQQEPEIFIEFANMLHANLVQSIFNKEEKELLEEKLKEVMSVYLALYAKYLYKL